MSYTKLGFIKGQVLKAEHLNHIEQGIEYLDTKISSATVSSGSGICSVGCHSTWGDDAPTGDASPECSPFILGDYASLQGNRLTGIRLHITRAGTISFGVKSFNAQQNFTRTLFVINATSIGERYFNLTSPDPEVTFVDAEVGDVYVNYGECFAVMLPTDTGNFLCSPLVDSSFIEDGFLDGFYAVVNGAMLNVSHQSLNILVEYETTRAGKKLNDVTFSIVGDSISTYAGRLVSDWADYEGAKYATFYPNEVSDVDDVHKTWWHKLMVNTGMKLLNNCAWSGSQVCGDVWSVTSANSSASDKRCLDIGHNRRNPDIIIVNIGINDFANGNGYLVGNWNGGDIPNNNPATVFSEAYALMLFKYMTIYPNARIFCCTQMEIGLFGRGANHNGELLKQYNDAIRRCAEALGADVIDLHACGINYFNLSHYVASDGTHPKEAGMELMAKKIEAELLAKF